MSQKARTRRAYKRQPSDTLDAIRRRSKYRPETFREAAISSTAVCRPDRHCRSDSFCSTIKRIVDHNHYSTVQFCAVLLFFKQTVAAGTELYIILFLSSADCPTQQTRGFVKGEASNFFHPNNRMKKIWSTLDKSSHLLYNCRAEEKRCTEPPLQKTKSPRARELLCFLSINLVQPSSAEQEFSLLQVPRTVLQHR